MGSFIFFVLLIFKSSFAYHGFNFNPDFHWDESEQSNFNPNFNDNKNKFRQFNSDRIVFQDDVPSSWNHPHRNLNNNNWNNNNDWNNNNNWNNINNWNNNNNNNNRRLPNDPTESPLRTSTVPIPGMATTRSPCENACRITQEYNPVCGTNGITYANERWLRCAQNCGRSVEVSYYGSCPRVG
nr:ras guanine nucleotide exchange factor P-like [Onthophagus taurus]